MCRSCLSSRMASIRIWSPSAARSRRFASGCSEIRSNESKDLLGDRLRRPVGLDRLDSLWEGLREKTIRIGDLPPEVVVLALDPVAAASEPPRRVGRLDLEQERPIGQPAADRR